MKKLRLIQAMIVVTVFLIVAFQAYYINRLYNSELKDLKKETDVLFRETVYKLQVARFKKDTTFFRRLSHDNVFNVQAVNVIKNTKKRIREVRKVDTSSPKRVFIAVTGTGTNPAEIPDDIRMRVESLTLRKPAQIRIISSTPDGSQVQVFSRKQLPLDSSHKIRFVDTLVRKEFTKELLPEVIVANNTAAAEVKRVEALPKRARIHLISDKKATTVSEMNSDRTIKVKTPLIDDPEIQIFTNNSNLNDSLPLVQLDSAYKKELKKSSISLPFSLIKATGNKSVLEPKDEEFKTYPASVGLLNPFHYQAIFSSPSYFLMQKIAPNILLSILLVVFTVGSFVLLYRNLIAQRRLADIKNEFISNITHELKTPIATVNVAIEAMKNFNVLQSPERTKEYLDISQSELQRLTLLVDKVLKLSMFEKKEIEVKKEWFNLKELVQEVMASMRLQFEKCKAVTSLTVNGDNFDIEADRLHITSVIYNLLDNALKYRGERSEIIVDLNAIPNVVELTVSDNGIGIAPEYKDKVFEQFFRVPYNNTHNTKGYGLGLSYVSHIIKHHKGSITVESELGKGSSFTVRLPYADNSTPNFNNYRNS